MFLQCDFPAFMDAFWDSFSVNKWAGQKCTGSGRPYVGFSFATEHAKCYCHPKGKFGKVPRAGMVSGSCSSDQPSPDLSGPLSYSDGIDPAAAVKLAGAAEVAIVVLAQTSHEGADRVNMTLDQSDLVHAIAAANPKTIVVTISPGPFLTPWRASVAAIVDFGFPGEQEVRSLAFVICGS